MKLCAGSRWPGVFNIESQMIDQFSSVSVAVTNVQRAKSAAAPGTKRVARPPDGVFFSLDAAFLAPLLGHQKVNIFPSRKIIPFYRCRGNSATWRRYSKPGELLCGPINKMTPSTNSPLLMMLASFPPPSARNHFTSARTHFHQDLTLSLSPFTNQHPFSFSGELFTLHYSRG